MILHGDLGPWTSVEFLRLVILFSVQLTLQWIHLGSNDLFTKHRKSTRPPLCHSPDHILKTKAMSSFLPLCSNQQNLKGRKHCYCGQYPWPLLPNSFYCFSSSQKIRTTISRKQKELLEIQWWQNNSQNESFRISKFRFLDFFWEGGIVWVTQLERLEVRAQRALRLLGWKPLLGLSTAFTKSFSCRCL